MLSRSPCSPCFQQTHCHDTGGSRLAVEVQHESLVVKLSAVRADAWEVVAITNGKYRIAFKHGLVSTRCTLKCPQYKHRASRVQQIARYQVCGIMCK